MGNDQVQYLQTIARWRRKLALDQVDGALIFVIRQLENGKKMFAAFID